VSNPWSLICSKLQIPSAPSDADVGKVDRFIAADFAAELVSAEFDAFVDELKADDEAWFVGSSRAAALGINDVRETAVIVLAGEWRSSEAYGRPYGRAFQLAAADAFGLAVPPEAASGVGEAARQLIDEHPTLWKQIIKAQYTRTSALLGSGVVVAHRGLSRATPAQAGGVDPRLRPLSSFSLDAGIAQHFPMTGSGGATVLQHADVPVERILATPATGFASLLEREIVVFGPSAGQTDGVRQS
jgi:hypothetical protein